MKILYLHGIGSGAESRTPRTLRKLLPDAVILAPELPIRPSEAYGFIHENYYMNDDFDLVIGTSLGGFYAQTLHVVKKILVNPAMFADEDIPKGIGMGKQDFLCNRSDGAKEYVIDDEFIAELAEIRKKIYNNKDMWHPGKMEVNECNGTYALFGTKDSTISHYDDFCRLYIPDHAVLFDGGHRLEENEIETVLLPLIKRVEDEDFPLVFVMDSFD